MYKILFEKFWKEGTVCTFKFIFLQAISWGINNSFEIGNEGSESMEITTDSSAYEINYLAKIGGDLIQFRCTRNWERYRAY